ncbi:hypothetical protein [Desulforhabdus amnigena]|jgi:hypothetical protein|uniref:Uncharacterized protein n=1 Tax=Desulforhabdus amnigena TaxID=40218 RepID=A0A9W6L842_9BACT|nr:hypothetical protein [Desulforhabdus amnigena]NLJ29597.1 hypothetical protein [Deltaproteobacteria bacterium]GLI35232.1 hypothetical protein DAMNIGENAA_26650 [Desulforhabdus amnigena]
MHLSVQTKSGIPVRLTVERDKYGVPQIYAHFRQAGEAEEKRYLCNGWGVRKSGEGFKEGIIIFGGILEVPKEDWQKMLFAREDLRGKDNLENIHLVKVYSQGNRLTIDGYTLSARIDKASWKKIASHMVEVDSTENDEVLSGGHFIGWIVKKGMEGEVERLLNVKPEKRVYPDL